VGGGMVSEMEKIGLWRLCGFSFFLSICATDQQQKSHAVTGRRRGATAEMQKLIWLEDIHSKDSLH
jgi:hypothetical protein